MFSPILHLPYVSLTKTQISFEEENSVFIDWRLSRHYGTEVVVYYKRRIKADVLNNESDVYSEKCTLYVDALGEDKCGNVYRIQFFIPKADFSGEFSLEMGENQTAHAFEAESLAGACGAGGSLWTYTVFGVNTADAE